ncbi:hypothetical protein E3T26_12880 [Cryobacterium sp. TMT1-21]|uniref:hypothetical protein n=1 Tax=unclassified Cryobacterium TaxID=2649013 RepID=UPI00106A7A08|nr:MULTISPECIES: hypothetical protein [unclassified Cryobacterium]TFD11312.1 hypothetical protein E3T26_12880 [Cryobacterium sp. TMT1-21]TFD17877.1 hypothetical protein E3T42_07025 [Cryobacterium sp. TMT4-10]
MTQSTYPQSTDPDGAARDFVPASHRDLPILRVFLPFIDRDENFARWSQYVDVEEHSGGMRR